VADRFSGPDFERDFPNVDGVMRSPNKSGCAIQPGEPHKLLQRVLAGIARHPNISGYVMIGLGCEVKPGAIHRPGSQAGSASARRTGPGLHDDSKRRGHFARPVEAGVAAVNKLLPFANAMKRTAQPLSKLILAENCGGSDGNSRHHRQSRLGRRFGMNSSATAEPR